jgi:DNA-damage-inducible protein J
MNKTATVRALIEPEKKAAVEAILQRMGLTHSEAINLLYSLILEYKGLPFDVRLPETSPEQSQTLSPELQRHLKESLKRNQRLGELLAK